MQNETTHGQERSQSCNPCEGPVCPGRIRLRCLEIHLDQSLGTRTTVSDGQTGSDTDRQVKCMKINYSTNSSMKTYKRFGSQGIVFCCGALKLVHKSCFFKNGWKEKRKQWNNKVIWAHCSVPIMPLQRTFFMWLQTLYCYGNWRLFPPYVPLRWKHTTEAYLTDEVQWGVSYDIDDK